MKNDKLTQALQAVMKDEKLTELMRGYEELHDTSNRKYSDNNVKEEIWKSTAGELEKSGDLVMKSHYASVPLSEACRDGLKAVQAALSSDAKELRLRASGLNSAHFTLSVFMIGKNRRGKSEEELTQSVNKVLKDFLEKWPPVELTFGSLGSFGSQIVFINVTNKKQLEALRQTMNDRLKEEGIYLADSRFTPHVTLFRAGRYGGGNASKLTVKDMVRRTYLPPVASSPINQIVFNRLSG